MTGAKLARWSRVQGQEGGTPAALLQRAAVAATAMLDAIGAAKKGGATIEALAPALALQRKAQWRLDFVAAENSMGFHAPAESARILGEAIDYARQAELMARTGTTAPVDAQRKNSL